MIHQKKKESNNFFFIICPKSRNRNYFNISKVAFQHVNCDSCIASHPPVTPWPAYACRCPNEDLPTAWSLCPAVGHSDSSFSDCWLSGLPTVPTVGHMASVRQSDTWPVLDSWTVRQSGCPSIGQLDSPTPRQWAFSTSFLLVHRFLDILRQPLTNPA